MTGCTTFQQSLTGDEKTFPPRRAEDVKVFLASETLPQPYKEVGSIVVTLSNEKDAVSFLKEKAAAMGADALMNCEVRVHTFVVVVLIIPIPIHEYVATAVAVKFSDQN
jgi:hypothetical protein